MSETNTRANIIRAVLEAKPEATNDEVALIVSSVALEIAARPMATAGVRAADKRAA